MGLEDFRAARTRVRPSGMREVALELPAVAWADVGGHARVKQRLQEAVLWPQQRAHLLRRLGAKVHTPHVSAATREDADAHISSTEAAALSHLSPDI